MSDPPSRSWRHCDTVYADSLVERIQASYIKMTASFRRLKRAFIIHSFEVVVGSCQRESALKPLILMSAFVRGACGAQTKNKDLGCVCCNKPPWLAYYNEPRNSLAVLRGLVPGSSQQAGIITSSETRREEHGQHPALMRFRFGPSIPTTVANKTPVACVRQTPGVVRARTRTGAPIWNRWPGVG